jgi:hypothetical protein
MREPNFYWCPQIFILCPWCHQSIKCRGGKVSFAKLRGLISAFFSFFNENIKKTIFLWKYQKKDTLSFKISGEGRKLVHPDLAPD